jgi:hypothetical protein
MLSFELLNLGISSKLNAAQSALYYLPRNINETPISIAFLAAFVTEINVNIEYLLLQKLIKSHKSLPM